MIKVTILTLVGLLLFLQYNLWFASDNIPEVLQLQRNIETQIQHNQRLQARNHILEVEILDLKQDSEAIEENARMDLGMIKEDEIFYRVIETGEN